MKISEIASTIEELSYDARTINSIQEVFFNQLLPIVLFERREK
ncbi:hypothetical protein [Emergencia timonensis]|nr:hypothetical protein [Emergencia timonensis]BDF10039.1 hypothetical protein CE91St48_34800 [Emergencia timonensis]BDF14122.1 hypothetical protein CE91St49_34690 [Emergencia timonensis]